MVEGPGNLLDHIKGGRMSGRGNCPEGICQMGEMSNTQPMLRICFTLSVAASARPSRGPVTHRPRFAKK